MHAGDLPQIQRGPKLDIKWIPDTESLVGRKMPFDSGKSFF